MPRLKQLAIVVMTASAAIAVAYTSKTAVSVPRNESPLGVSAPTIGSQAPAARPRAIGKAPFHQGALTTFYSPEYGLAFRYPRFYALEEGDAVEHSFFLKRQEELDLEQPDARLVVTVQVPEDAYPNTNFLFGSLQVVAAESTSRESCRENLLRSPSDDSGQTSRKVRTEDPQWEAIESQSAIAGTEVLQRDYSAFSEDVCYQFSAVVATDELGTGDGVRRADVGRIMRQLEKIITGSQFFQRAEPPSQRIEE